MSKGKTEIPELSTDHNDADNYHVPVLLKETVEGLNIKPDGVYVDCTFGGGGHSREILKCLNEKGKLFAFDQDADAVQNIPNDHRVIFVPQNFRHLVRFLRLHQVTNVDGILADLGVSSHQFDEADRGFSIRFNANMDMRMDRRQSRTAFDILQQYSELQLHKMFEKYGEVTNAKTLAKRIVDIRNSVSLHWEASLSFAEILHHTGHVPLPPYIKRADEQTDKSRYQTVFARFDGSVAAPTAGLHFTNEVLHSLQQKGISKNFVTLHVGAGTFKPVKADSMLEHEMHSEFIEVEFSFIETLLKNLYNPVVAVGTTSLRTLESLYWLGNILIENPNAFDTAMPVLEQWIPYEDTPQHNTVQALEALLHFLQKHNHSKLLAKTQIIIAPEYTFKIVSGLVTNFHQPSSTLLLLVAAFIGDDWKKVYDYALENNFRFLSYGDGNLLWRN